MPTYVIWPEYFAGELTRRKGRRVPKNLSVAKVTPEMFERACRDLGWVCRVEESKYPRTWFMGYGFKVIVEVNNESEGKNRVLKKLALKLKELSRGNNVDVHTL